jgi:hypothetical protein
VFLTVILSPTLTAQVMTVKKLNTDKARWPKLAAEQKQIQFVGRYRSAGGVLHLEKLDVPCRLPATIQLPARITEGEVMELTGKFVQENGKLTFQVSRIAYRGPVTTEITKRAEAIPAGRADDLLKLADEYVEQAEFYTDKKLFDEIAHIRTLALESKRQGAQGNAVALRAVKSLAESLKVDAQFLKNVHFEILFAESKLSNIDIASLIVEVQKLEAWDRQVPPVPDTLKIRFDKEAPTIYDTGTTTERELLHRQLYSVLRLKQLRSMLKDDGSNGLQLAELVRKEFTDQGELCNTFEQREVDYQLSKVNQLSRQELQQLTTLLERLKKRNLIEDVLAKWLAAQEARFGTETLAGLLRTADEYLFVGDSWKRAEHHATGVELLKKSWTIASTQSPDDAPLIADRLTVLGWEHIGGRWLTKQQVQALPKDDLQIAMREARVVKGMTEDQVSKFLGKPNRIARIGSSRSMSELWIYDAEGSAGLVVRFQKGTSLTSANSRSIVEDVSKIPGR